MEESLTKKPPLQEQLDGATRIVVTGIRNFGFSDPKELETLAEGATVTRTDDGFEIVLQKPLTRESADPLVLPLNTMRMEHPGSEILIY